MTMINPSRSLTFAQRNPRQARELRASIPLLSVRRTILTVLLSTTAATTLGVAVAHAQAGHGSPSSVPTLYEQKADSSAAIADGPTQNSRRFGRLFELNATFKDSRGRTRKMIPHPSDVEALRRLGAGNGPMHAKSDSDVRDSNVPAGYTFFGQFIDHDVTLDTVSRLDRPIADLDTDNARTPALDLDCVYGGGPERTPYLYDLPYLVQGTQIAPNRYDLLRRTTLNGAAPSKEAETQKPTPRKKEEPRRVETVKPQPKRSGDSADAINSILGTIGQSNSGSTTESQAAPSDNAAKPEQQAAKPETVENPDTQAQMSRPSYGNLKRDVAMIGDPRNDENLVISQIQAAFIAYHNRIVDLLLAKDGIDLKKLRADADAAGNTERGLELQSELHRITNNIFERARHHTVHYYHRMIVEDYLPRIIGLDRVQSIRTDGRRFYYPDGFVDRSTGSKVIPLMPVEFSVAAYRFGHAHLRDRMTLRDGVSNIPLFGFNQGPDGIDMRGFRPIDQRTLIDWRYFFPVQGDYSRVQAAKALSPKLPDTLFKLHHGGIVPPSDVVSLAARNLNRGRIFSLPSGQDIARAMGLSERELVGPDTHTREVLRVDSTPLWYYILQESAQQGIVPLERSPFSLARAGALAQSTDVYQGGQTGTAEIAAAVKKATGSEGGDILGPVGGTIVGEVLLGLVDHYRETTGHGLGFPSELGNVLSVTQVGGVGEVYQVGNMLLDAGVAAPVQ